MYIRQLFNVILNFTYLCICRKAMDSNQVARVGGSRTGGTTVRTDRFTRMALVMRVLREWLPQEIIDVIVNMVQGEEYRMLRREVGLMRELQPEFPQDTLYPSNCGQFRWNREGIREVGNFCPAGDCSA